jgi:hypothetical protein
MSYPIYTVYSCKMCRFKREKDEKEAILLEPPLSLSSCEK